MSADGKPDPNPATLSKDHFEPTLVRRLAVWWALKEVNRRDWERLIEVMVERDRRELP